MIVHVWTRVHVDPNPGRGGVGIVFEAYEGDTLKAEKEIGHAFKRVTNYQAEIEAVSHAVMSLTRPSNVLIYSSSQPFVLSAKKLPNTSLISAEKTAFETLNRLIIEGGHTVKFEFAKANSHTNFDLAKMIAMEYHGGDHG